MAQSEPISLGAFAHTNSHKKALKRKFNMSEQMPKITTSTTTLRDSLYLSGGLCAGTNLDGRLFIAPDVNGEMVVFQLSDKNGYTNAFHKFGLEFIGWEEVGDDYSNWNLHPVGNTWRSASDYWNALAYGAHAEGKPEFSETARSIAFSLLTASLRMRDVCREYTGQNIRATKSKIAHGRRFSNVGIFELYMALHSFLAESCSARDYLAQCIAAHFFQWPNIKTMAMLSQKLVSTNDTTPVGMLVRQACDQASPAGWMARLSKYRNLIIHQAPINKIAKESMLRANTIEIQGKTFYQITLAMPKDPMNLSDAETVDAQVQFRSLLLNLMDFARKVGELSGVGAKLHHITDADLK